jgi:hypothetical protein
MSSPGADENGISRIQKTRTEFHHSSQGRGTELVLSSEKDVEKGPLDNYGPSDLRYCLTLSNEANEAVGIQPKHVGVTWEDLQVVVHGDRDKDCKVKSLSSKPDRPSYFSIRHTSRHLTVGSFVVLGLLETYSLTSPVYMLQDGFDLIRSVGRFPSGNPPARDGNTKMILNK